jgi:hypothetical protein
MTVFNTPAQSRPKVGRAIFKESLRTLRKDPQVMAIPLLAIGADLVFAVVIGISWILLIPFMDINNATNSVNIALGITYAVFAAIAHVLSQAAVMFAANERFEGRNPTVGSALSAAFKKFGPLSLFGLLEATVGLVLRYIADNIKVLGDVVRFIGGLAWAISTYFAIPFILFENRGPFGAIGESAKLIKAKWGEVLRGNVAASAVFVLFYLLAFGGFVGGLVLTFSGCNTTTACNINWAGPGVIGLSILVLLFTGLASSSVMAYVRIALFRYASGKSLPDFDSGLLANSFRVKN